MTDLKQIPLRELREEVDRRSSWNEDHYVKFAAAAIAGMTSNLDVFKDMETADYIVDGMFDVDAEESIAKAADYIANAMLFKLAETRRDWEETA